MSSLRSDAARAPRRSGRTAAATPARRSAILDAAAREIARVGAGGLRLRSVAEAAGVHHATVLYHFPSRADLLDAVVAHIEADFRRPHVPPPSTADAAALLRWQFDDIRTRLAADMDLTAALVELTLLARRSRPLAAALERMYSGWRYHLVGILRRGVHEGVFRADADLAAIAALVMAQVKGIGLEVLAGASPERVDALVALCRRQVEQALARA